MVLFARIVSVNSPYRLYKLDTERPRHRPDRGLAYSTATPCERCPDFGLSKIACISLKQVTFSQDNSGQVTCDEPLRVYVSNVQEGRIGGWSKQRYVIQTTLEWGHDLALSA